MWNRLGSIKNQNLGRLTLCDFHKIRFIYIDIHCSLFNLDITVFQTEKIFHEKGFKAEKYRKSLNGCLTSAIAKLSPAENKVLKISIKSPKLIQV